METYDEFVDGNMFSIGHREGQSSVKISIIEEVIQRFQLSNRTAV